MAAGGGLCRATPFAMKTFPLVFGSLIFAAAALSAAAAFQSARVLPDNRAPVYPGSLTLQGITRGRALIAVSIDETGRVKDLLPLAYSNIRFARASTEALQDWRFEPARADGQPVPVQLEMRFDYTLEGAVITTNIVNHFFFDNYDNIGDNALVYRPASPRRLDRAPVRVSGEEPKYATAAEKNGVRGSVSVRFYIDETGAVRQPAVTSDADPYLADQAMQAVRSWKFEPVTSRGRPVLVIAQQEFKFGGDR
jgi:TonB family protein